MKIKIGAKILSSIFVVQLLFGFIISIRQTVFADASKNLQISAIVPPHVSDFQFEFVLDHDQIETEKSIVSYKITYGAKKSAYFPTNTKLIVDWDTSTAVNETSIFDYVEKSATDAYGDTKPIVNHKNHTITWTIKNLPAGTTGKSVSLVFKINKTSEQTAKPFTIRALMSNQYLELPEQKTTGLLINTYPPQSPSNQAPSVPVLQKLLF